MSFPSAVPEIPVAHVNAAAAYYAGQLGFTIDFGDEEGGISGISRGNCRLFLTGPAHREQWRNHAPVVIWLNLASKGEVDDLFTEWTATQAKLVSKPEDKPWKLREFIAADLDGNLVRVFYDFRLDERQ